MFKSENELILRFVVYAGMFGDKEIARSQLAKIGDAWDQCVWQEQQYFEYVVNWVNN